MKKILFLALCLSALACLHAQSYSATWSSGHIHVTGTDSMSHDSTTCMSLTNIRYTITIDSSYVNDIVRLVDTAAGVFFYGGPFINYAGASPWTFTISEAGSPANFEGLIPLTGGYMHFNGSQWKVTTALDTLRYLTYSDSLWVLPCLYGIVSGDAYLDYNLNCIFDSGDVGLTNYNVNITDHLSGPVPYLEYSAYEVGPSYYPYGTYIQKSWVTYYTVSLPSYFSFLFLCPHALLVPILLPHCPSLPISRCSAAPVSMCSVMPSLPTA